MVLLVVDPRKVKSYSISAPRLSPEVRAKTKPFLLVPSTTSSPASLTLLETSLQCFGMVTNAIPKGASIKVALR